MGTGEDRAAVAQPIGVGPEMAALGRFHRDVTWKGTIHEGGMGPGTPAMTAVGRGTVQAIQDERRGSVRRPALVRARPPWCGTDHLSL
jgi:hypothetical protein